MAPAGPSSSRSSDPELMQTLHSPTPHGDLQKSDWYLTRKRCYVKLAPLNKDQLEL